MKQPSLPAFLVVKRPKNLLILVFAHSVRLLNSVQPNPSETELNSSLRCRGVLVPDAQGQRQQSVMSTREDSCYFGCLFFDFSLSRPRG